MESCGRNSIDDSAEWKIAEFICLEEKKKKSRGKHKQAKGKETSQLTLNPTKVQECGHTMYYE